MPDKSNIDHNDNIPIYIKISVSLISLLLFLFISEFALRAMDTDFYYKNQFFPVNRDIDFTEVYKKDCDLFWRFRENQKISSRRFSYIDYQINSSGLRGPEIQKDKPDLRILALGNSCTFGWGVPYEQTWVSLLQNLIEKKEDIQTEVICAGVPGYSSHQGKIFFEKELLGLEPDIVLIMFGWNDQWSAGQGITDAEQETPSEWIIYIHNLLSPLKLYQAVRKIILTMCDDEKKAEIGDLSSTCRVGIDQFYMNLRSIVRTAQNNNIQPILLIPPVASLGIYIDADSSPLHAKHKRYQNEIRRLGQKENVPVVDLQTLFDNYNTLFDDAYSDPVHFNAQGHGVAALTIDSIINNPIYSKK